MNKGPVNHECVKSQNQLPFQTIKWSSLVWLGVTDEQRTCQSAKQGLRWQTSHCQCHQLPNTNQDSQRSPLICALNLSHVTTKVWVCEGNQPLSMSPIVKQQNKIPDDLLFSKCKSRLLTSSNFNPDVLLHIPFFLPVFVHWISAMQLQKCERVEETR